MIDSVARIDANAAFGRPPPSCSAAPVRSSIVGRPPLPAAS